MWRTREVIRSKAARRPRAAGGATIFIDRTAGRVFLTPASATF